MVEMFDDGMKDEGRESFFSQVYCSSRVLGSLEGEGYMGSILSVDVFVS